MTAETRLQEIVSEIEETGDLAHVMELISLSPEGANWRTPLTGDSLLHLSVQHNNTPLTASLIQMGANPNVTSDRGQTPLHYAAKILDSVDIVELLLAAGARCDMLDENRQSPLYVAARRGNIAFVNQLLRSGFQIDLRSVSRLGWVDIAALLFETSRSETADLDLLLDDAIKSNSLSLVQLLLDKGADPNGKGGLSPLLSVLLAETPNPAIAEVLLQRGASPSAADSHGRSLVSLATKMADAGDQYQSLYHQIAALLSRFGKGN